MDKAHENERVSASEASSNAVERDSVDSIGRDPKGHAVFLLGAGASVEAGLPSSGELLGQLEEWFDACIASGARADLITPHHNQRLIEQRRLLQLIVARISALYPPDIENVMVAVQDLRSRGNNVLGQFVEVWNTELERCLGVDATRDDLFTLLFENALYFLWRTLSVEGRGDYLQALREFRPAKNAGTRVYSLNYDLLIEEACGIEYVNDGFRLGTNGLFDFDDPTLFNGIAQEAIRLVKLHGSINWISRPGRVHRICPRELRERVQRDFGALLWGEDDVPPLIFAQRNKVYAGDPYLTLLFHFYSDLVTAKTLVVIGCRCEDVHVKQLVAQAARQGLQIITINKSLPRVLGELGACWLQGTAGAFLTGDGLVKLKRELEATGVLWFEPPRQRPLTY